MPIPKIDEVENIARLARLNLAKDGSLVQVAFLWTGPRVAIIGGRPLRSQSDKAAWATIIRRACVEMGADAILTVTEVWAANAPKGITQDDLIGPVQGKTGAYEAVLFHLESMDGTWMCVCPIIRAEGQAPTFPMPRHWSEGQTQGLLANFIPDKKASAYRGAPPEN
jgi:hypothetical protein